MERTANKAITVKEIAEMGIAVALVLLAPLRRVKALWGAD